MHVIAAKAVAFEEALRPDFKVYARRVVENASALAEINTTTRARTRSSIARLSSGFAAKPSRTSRIRRPISWNSAMPKPRVVAAGLPRRMPEVTVGFSGSNGTVHVAGDPGALETVFRCRAGQPLWPEIDQEEIIVSAARHQIQIALDHALCARRFQCIEWSMSAGVTANSSAKSTPGKREVTENQPDYLVLISHCSKAHWIARQMVVAGTTGFPQSAAGGCAGCRGGGWRGSLGRLCGCHKGQVLATIVF